MKKKISITLPADLRLEIDRLIGDHGSRSAFIEKVLSDHFKELAEREIPARDVPPVDAASAHSNRQLEDALSSLQ